ncbi:hypothetical protein MMC25_006264 [Agyrium rufum]|nr:hypothetical protein [Agyrium rufum]
MDDRAMAEPMLKNHYDILPRDLDLHSWIPYARHASRKRKIIAFLILAIILEVIHGFLFFLGYSLFQHLKDGPEASLDGLTALHNYNTTKKFSTHLEFVYDSKLADTFWDQIQPNSGLLSLNTRWAAQQSLPTSAPNPYSSEESIYQVDVYHSLHCLALKNKIRKSIVSEEESRQDPKHDKHILHCIDYIRQALICNGDLLLGTTQDYQDYGLNDAHTCRDYGALMTWVKAHEWKGFHEWAYGKSETTPP